MKGSRASGPGGGPGGKAPRPSFARKALKHLQLLRQDPERFGRNLLQLTNPALFEQRITDVLGSRPMHVRVAADPATPRLNVLDTAWTHAGMTGGPNTIVNLACRVARAGIAVRLVSTQSPAELDPAWLHAHAASLLGAADVPVIQIATAGQPDEPLSLGAGDMFLASHWSTCRQLVPVLPMLPIRRFFYMLQEFEPGFYPWSSNFALAAETYEMDFWPIVNERLLADFLFAQEHGRLREPDVQARALVFEPAVDRGLFHPRPAGQAGRPRRLLFYARPTNTRNMFGLGLLALRQATADPMFADWEFLSIGSRGSVPELALGAGHVLRPAPWADYAGYGNLLRSADVLLCPMLSPHTSYPVLEMAACGGVAVTNVFATKTAAALAAISPSIIAVPATVSGLADGLIKAAGHGGTGSPILNMPVSWDDALDPVAQQLVALIRTATLPHDHATCRVAAQG